jgi:hypothetical protein
MITLGPLTERIVTHLREAPEPRAESTPPPTPPAPPATRVATGAASTLRIEHAPLTTAEADQPIVIEARALPALGNHMLLVLHRLAGESSFAMAKMAGSGVLTAEIPAQPAGARIEYCIRALDASGRQAAREPEGDGFFEVAVGGAPEAPVTVTPSTAPVVAKGGQASKSAKAAAAAEKREREAAAKAAAREQKELARAEKARGKSAATSQAESGSKKKGGKTWLWIGAGAVVAGVAAAAGGGGGGGSNGGGPPPPSGPLPQPPGRP